jgi:catechol 2,3-dioxygenase-like lactoylglutathione lyase family enzyme
MKIKVTSIYVDNEEKALRFYTGVLGTLSLHPATTFHRSPVVILCTSSAGAMTRQGPQTFSVTRSS